jgi:DNA (cytosine-5)-methyltransferase 1
MKLLSLFDGSGAFGLAAERHGIKARYGSEIEPFPIAVTRARFPQMEHLGDITKIDGGKIVPCDIVSFGSPCTDISIAGKGEGISAARSGLFFEAVRVIREMLEASVGDFPRYFMFENVPNLISLHGGVDWKIVMDEFASLGFICDPDILDAQEFGVAQRRKRIFIVGVNRKFYDPADFANVENCRDKRMQKAVDAWGGEIFHGITSRPHEIRRQHLSEILEREVDPKYYLTKAACLGILRRVDAKGKEIPPLLRSALENQAGLFSCAESGEPMTFEPGATSRLPKGKYWSGIAPTLRADAGDNQVAAAIPIDTRNATRNGGTQGVGVGKAGEPSYTITAERQHAIAVSNHPADSRIGINEQGLADCLTSRCGTGEGNVPMCAEPVAYGICAEHSNSMNSANPHSGIYETETAKTLTTGTQTPSNQGGLVIAQDTPVYCMEQNSMRPSHKGKGVSDSGVAYTINTVEQSNVAYAMTTGSFANVAENISQTLTARQFKDPPIVNEAYSLDRAAYNQGRNALFKPQIDVENTHALTAQGPGAVSAPPSYVVRRLTPRECLVLMNLPPDWCDDIGIAEPTEDDFLFWEAVFLTLGKKKSRKQIAKWLANPYSDGACYKMAGNGVVTAVVDWIFEGIVHNAR